VQFSTRKRRQPPAIIIISLIDILIVLLIFLMVTTTFKQQPALKITLPESKQAVKGSVQDRVIVTVNKQEPFFYFKARAVTLVELQTSLRNEARTNPKLGVNIQVDEASTFGNALKAMEAARAADLLDVKFITREAGAK